MPHNPKLPLTARASSHRPTKRRVSLQSVFRTCFNWVIAEYTPAPFPNQPQNEVEQLLIIVAQLDFGCGSLEFLLTDAVDALGETRERDMTQPWLPEMQRNSSRGRLPSQVVR